MYKHYYKRADDGIKTMGFFSLLETAFSIIVQTLYFSCRNKNNMYIDYYNGNMLFIAIAQNYNSYRCNLRKYVYSLLNIWSKV